MSSEKSALRPNSPYFLKRGPSPANTTHHEEKKESYGTSRGTPSKETPKKYLSGTAAGQQGQFSWYNPFSWNSKSSQGYQRVPGQPIQKPRKVPVKVEPKVFFANERTFLAWLHMSVTLASISMAIVAFADANEWSQLYGLMLMPVSIGFCIYSLWLYMKRASMIRRRDPGPYEDRVGPVVLGVLLAVSIVINFFMKLYDVV